MKLKDLLIESQVKLKRINSGYYEGVYKSVKFEIIKAEDINSFRNNWYWICGNEGGQDHFSKKWIAIEAVKEWIDELK